MNTRSLCVRVVHREVDGGLRPNEQVAICVSFQDSHISGTFQGPWLSSTSSRLSKVRQRLETLSKANGIPQIAKPSPTLTGGDHEVVLLACRHATSLHPRAFGKRRPFLVFQALSLSKEGDSFFGEQRARIFELRKERRRKRRRRRRRRKSRERRRRLGRCVCVLCAPLEVCVPMIILCTA